MCQTIASYVPMCFNFLLSEKRTANSAGLLSNENQLRLCLKSA
jgi:hypothetical protein